MRVLLSAVWVMLLAVAGQAAPLPLPPDGFSGGQYVDGGGCVWQREDGGWQRRLDGAGVSVCGFPPTRSARRTDPEIERVLAPEFPPQPPSPEDVLTGQLAAGLRQGEFLADPRPMEVRRTPDLAATTDPIATQVSELARSEAALRSALSGGGAAGSDLCRLLGYVPDTATVPVLGGDVTQGMCPGMRAPKPEDRITEGVVASAAPKVKEAGPVSPSSTAAVGGLSGAALRSVTAAGAAAPSAQPGQPRAALSGQPSVAASASAAKAVTAPDATRGVAGQVGAVGVVSRRQGAAAVPATGPAPATVEMIPATARYVQIGGFRDDRNAQLAIRRLSTMGYRVAQKRGRTDDTALRVILAGPFTDRQALVAALNRLRAEGYPGATAR